MALPDLSFDPPYDIHLLRGQTTILKSILFVGDLEADSFSEDEVSFEFTPFFRSEDPIIGYYEYDGIMVYQENGLIVAGEGVLESSEYKLNNFIVKAKATKPAGSTEPESSVETYIRIHIHESLESVWLSPETLTVQQDIGLYKFSVYAHFNDDTVAEIGDIFFDGSVDAVRYDFAADYTITFTSPTENLITIDGKIHPQSIHPIGDHSVQVNVDVGGIRKSATAKIKVDNQLSESNTEMVAELVCSGGPGSDQIDEVTNRIDQVTNVLFLPDGFTLSDRNVFDRMVDTFIEELRSGKLTSPFDLLSESINYWKVFLHSNQRGATYHGEIAVGVADSDIQASMIQTKKPAEDKTSDEWEVNEMFFKVGIPVKADQDKTPEQIKDYWEKTTILTTEQIEDIDPEVIEKWKKFGNRRLPEEKDTVLGIHINDYTYAEKYGDYGFINFYGKRISRTHLDVFLSKLKNVKGEIIGTTFLRLRHTDLYPTGKDYKNIIILSATDFARPINTGSACFINCFWRKKEIFDVTDVPELLKCYSQVPVDPHSDILLDNELSIYTKATIIHELGHSFGLGDEYGEPSEDESYAEKPVDDITVRDWEYALYTGSPEYLDNYLNIQARQDILSPDSDLKGQIDAEKIKWYNYHRIESCGILKDAVVKSDSSYVLKLQKGHSSHFNEHEFVKLRKSIYLCPIAFIDREDSPDPEIVSDTIKPLISNALFILNINPELDEIRVNPAGAPPDARFFTLDRLEQIIVYKPMFNEAGHIKRIIAPPVTEYIKENPYAFNTVENKEIIDESGDQDSSLPFNLVPGCSKNDNSIVGIYSGGKRCHGHVYHPTGHCTMRYHISSYLPLFTFTNVYIINEFCPVCKYGLVDQIDPTKHGELDPIIGNSEIYPE